MPTLTSPRRRRLATTYYAPGQSINGASPLTAGLRTWYLAQPRLMRGFTWPDLTQENPGTLIAMAESTTASGWQPTERPGGRGELRFDGVDDYVVGTKLLNLPRITLGGWIKLESYALTNGFIMGFADGIGAVTHDKVLYITSAGLPFFYCFDGLPKTTSTPSVSIPLSIWTWVMAVADGVNAYVYVNGVQVGSVAAGNTFVGYTVPNLFVNGTDTGVDQSTYLRMAVDSMRLYDRGLTPLEMRALYQGELAMHQQLLTPFPLGVRTYFFPASAQGQTLAAQPAQARWQADIGTLRRVLSAQPAQAQWQADRPQTALRLQAQPAHAKWQADTPTLRRVLTAYPAQSQWQATTTQARRVLAGQPAQAQWQADTPQTRRVVNAQPAQAQYQAVTPQLTGTGQRLSALPAQAQWQVVTPALRRTLQGTPTQSQWQAVAPGLRMTVRSLPAQGQWQAGTARLYGVSQVLDVQPAQAQWQVGTPTLVSIVVPGVFPLPPVNLTLVRATAVVTLQKGR